MNYKKYKQEHLMTYYSELSEDEKTYYDEELANLDLELIHEIYKNRNNEIDGINSEVRPLFASKLSTSEHKAAYDIGLQAIKNGEVAVVLMAGGQGSRLGHLGPKGTFDIGLPSGKSLFALQCDRLIRLQQMTGTYIKWYIMTSEDNHNETINHFKANNYFDYNKDSICFFKQDRLPLILENGKIAMKSKYEINFAANGNGGVFSSLASNKLLHEMKLNHVKWIYLYGVDNAIARVADPAFVGFTIQSGKSIASKAVDKVEPKEKVGVICYRNNHPDIVEYSELPDRLSYETDAENKLVYRNGNILSHIFSLDFLMSCTNKKIVYHAAHKKVDYINNGQLVVPSEPNGYKFELFLFDMFKYADDMAVMTVKREEEFTPVKNKEGNDSPYTAREHILNQHYKWLLNSGHKCKFGTEVNMRKTYAGEDLSNKILSEITLG